MKWEVVKNWFDVGALVVLLGWFVEALPAIATGLTCIWWAIRIYETPTIQRLLGRLRR